MPDQTAIEPTAQLDFTDLINRVIDVQGAIRLAAAVVLDNAGDNKELSGANGVLSLAESETDRIYATLSTAQAAAWRES